METAPRPMRPEEEAQVRAIFAACHPDWVPRMPDWYWAYPTLVIEREGGVVGFTSGSLSFGTTGLTLFGNDVCVAPAWQGHGLGWALAEARHAMGRAFGATMFVGFTAVGNQAMRRIFQRQGLHACQALPHFFGQEDGESWVGAL